MARTKASQETKQRVGLLIDALFHRFPSESETVTDLAQKAGLGHETVRVLQKRLQSSSGPGFLVVADLARARGISLDQLAEQTQPKKATK